MMMMSTPFPDDAEDSGDEDKKETNVIVPCTVDSIFKFYNK